MSDWTTQYDVVEGSDIGVTSSGARGQAIMAAYNAAQGQALLSRWPDGPAPCEGEDDPVDRFIEDRFTEWVAQAVKGDIGRCDCGSNGVIVGAKYDGQADGKGKSVDVWECTACGDQYGFRYQWLGDVVVPRTPRTLESY